IVSECEKSLRRLGTDFIDIYFAHAEDAGTPVEETLRAFDKLIRDGKVRCIGASNHQAWRLAEAELMARAAGLPHYVVLQQRFSYLQPVVGADFGTQLPLTPEQTDFCARHGVLLMAYSPLLGGLYEKPEIPVPVQYRSEHSDKLLELLRRRAAEWGYTPSQLVLGWMLALSPCVVPEVTASRLEHLEANLREVDPAHAAVFAEEVASVDSFTVKYS
uniref:aldo/keto reductase n=1 Tax=Alistipes indistinctus TaxID=626932 RepID=UPI004025A4C4